MKSKNLKFYDMRKDELVDLLLKYREENSNLKKILRDIKFQLMGVWDEKNNFL